MTRKKKGNGAAFPRVFTLRLNSIKTTKIYKKKKNMSVAKKNKEAAATAVLNSECETNK